MRRKSLTAMKGFLLIVAVILFWGRGFITPVYAEDTKKLELPDGIMNAEYKHTFQAPKDMTEPYWSVAPQNTLPPGLGLTSGGYLIGKPTAIGKYNFVLNVQEEDEKKSKPIVYNVLLEIIPHKKLEILDGTVGKKYNHTFQAPKEMKEPHWSVAPKNILPPGLELTSTDGALKGVPTAVGKYNFVLSVQEKDDKKSKPTAYKVLLKVTDPVELNFSATETLRMLVGYEMLQARDSSPHTNWFMDVYVSQPFPVFNKYSDRLKMNPCRVWLNVRFTSIPVNDEQKLGAVSADYFSAVKDLSLTQMAQAGEFSGGLDYTFGRVESKKLVHTLGFVAGGGVYTSFQKVDDNIRIYEMNSVVKEKYMTDKESEYKIYNNEDLTDNDFNKKYVAYENPQTNRFYRQYYAGLRFKRYIKKKDNADLVFPGTVDLTFGFKSNMRSDQGEVKERSFIRLDCFLPFKLSKNLPVYLFCTVVAYTNKAESEYPLRLKDVSDEITLPSDEVLILQLKEAHPFRTTHDYFRIGVGFDLTKVFSKLGI